eukprot:m51a1_g14568 hypothetical protein (206) ;mRNA; r:1063739-1064356
MTKYTVRVSNGSVTTKTFCMFQTAPTEQSNIKSLAWFSQPLASQVVGTFEWSVEYSFVWSQTKELRKGVMFYAAQTVPADPVTGADSLITFGLNGSGAFQFSDQRPGSKGTLTIHCDGTAPAHTAAVGIGMSGSGTFAVQAEPNIDVSFLPHPSYWLCTADWKQGEVVDVEWVTQSVKIEYPYNMTTATVTLGQDNKWSTVIYSM